MYLPVLKKFCVPMLPNLGNLSDTSIKKNIVFACSEWLAKGMQLQQMTVYEYFLFCFSFLPVFKDIFPMPSSHTL